MIITVKVTKSSHPDFDLFASAMVNGHQLFTRGNQTDVDVWYDALAAVAQQHGHTVELINES